MNSTSSSDPWVVEKIAVVGPGIVGMPMAAMLAHAGIRIGTDHPARVVVVQRNSPTSGWKVDAINRGRSVIGGIEPDLDRITGETVRDGLLRASHDPHALSDADVILVCVQTDKTGLAPDYGPMMAALTNVAEALQHKPSGKTPVIVFESTLAPSTMATVVKDHFAAYGLVEGRDVLLGNSPNRVMPGRLVERVAQSDKLIGGLHPATVEKIKSLYAWIVTQGTLYTTNSMTAEVVKTLENAYRDIRIAFAAEMVRHCDAHDTDFYQVREEVNRRLSQEDDASTDPNAVPVGGLLIPTVGVGGHCLPKDGILMSWRLFETPNGTRNSLVMEARAINDAAPAETIRLAESRFGTLDGKTVALLGTAYRFNSEDTRNSPTLPLAQLLQQKGCRVVLHDPYVKPDDQKLRLFGLQDFFTRDLGQALSHAAYAIFCTGHRDYAEDLRGIVHRAPVLEGIVDGCNLYPPSATQALGIATVGIGRGTRAPDPEFVDFVYRSFRAMETGVANEVRHIVDFLNQHYAADAFNRVDFAEVQRIASTCVTGCDIAEPGTLTEIPEYDGFRARLTACAFKAQRTKD
jgi:UDP-N-acetyl-D-mannosaminuronic acid dehydrogenase